MTLQLVKTKIVQKDLKRTPRSYAERKIRTTNRKTGTSLDKPIQYYGLWFRYLKLCLELESLKVRFFRKNKFGKNTGKGIPVKVNRKKYEGWDLDQILDSPYYRWWESHRHLFDESSLEVLKEGDTVDSDKNFGYFKIDLRKKKHNILRELDVHLKLTKQRQKPHKTNQFRMEGRFEYDSILLRYNVFIRDFNGQVFDELYDLEDRFDDTDKEKYEYKEVYVQSESLKDAMDTIPISKLKEMYENCVMTKQEYFFHLEKRKKQQNQETKKVLVDKLKHPQELKKDIRRLVRDTQKILLGVSQGGFVRRVKIS